MSVNGNPFYKEVSLNHLDWKAVKLADGQVLTARRGVLGYLLQLLSDYFLIRGRYTAQSDKVQPVADIVLALGRRFKEYRIASQMT